MTMSASAPTTYRPFSVRSIAARRARHGGGKRDAGRGGSRGHIPGALAQIAAPMSWRQVAERIAAAMRSSDAMVEVHISEGEDRQAAERARQAWLPEQAAELRHALAVPAHA